MLELKNISFDVKDENDGYQKEIIKNINLQIDSNKFVVITGPNGGGKSSLAKIIMGIEKPTKGSILFDGQDITNLNVTQRADSGIGFAFQQPVRFKGLLVRDLLSFAAKKPLTIDEACNYLAQVGLCAVDYVDRELNDSLSGGEAKRIEIAMLMARNVKLSVFDEPEAGIDLWGFQNLISIFEELRAKTKGSVVIISHQERILEIADEIIVIADGKIADKGSSKNILPKLLCNIDTCEYYRKKA